MSERNDRTGHIPARLTLLSGASLGVVAILFILSGAAGLVYEVLWIRSLTLIFGKTVHAASAVLAAFMAGLALGSAAGGRLVDRDRIAPLKLYAILEAGVGLWALLLPAVFAAIGWLYAALAGPFEQLPVTLSATRFILATLAMMPATALMGATLPALSRWAVQRRDHVTSRLGLLYALNTLGGMIGCLAAGFFLLERFGLRGTTALAVTGNMAVAGIALWLGRGHGAVSHGGGGKHKAEALPETPDQTEREGPLWLVFAAVAVGGFAALVLEVTWTRTLLLVFGSTSYSFSAMLTVFLLGIGGGSLLMTPFAARLKHPWLVLGLIQGGIGLLVLASLRVVDHLPGMYLAVLARGGLTYGNELLTKFLISAGLMLLPTLLSGMAWPLAVRLQRPRRESIGRDVGRLYAANTIGSIVGSLAGAFAFLPVLGMQNSFAAVSVMMAAFGAACVMASGVSLFKRAAVAIGIVLLAGGMALTGRPWDRRLLTSGAYFMPTAFLDEQGRSILDERLKETRLLYYAEGVTTTPSVAILGDINKAFFNDGKIEGASALDGMRLQRMLGHLPTLLHSGEPKRALNIGLGSGITVGAMGLHPFTSVDCAEIEPVVVPAARLFDPETFSILDRPGFRLLYNDGRNHLMLTRDTYDVMSSMPFAPLVSGAASLYSLEHFRLVKARLAKGGLMSQYLPLYQLSPEDFLSIMRTFAEVFPEATVWFTGTETVLIGSEAPQRIDFERLAARMSDPRVALSLRAIGLDDPVRLLSMYCFRVRDVLPDLAKARVNTDDWPQLEFSAPRSHLVNTVKVNLPWLLARRTGPEPILDYPASWSKDDSRRSQIGNRLKVAQEAQRLTIEGRLQVLRGDLNSGIATFERSIAADQGDMYARNLAARNLVKLADRAIAAGRMDEAIRIYERALHWEPRHFLALYNLARLVYDRGESARARTLTELAIQQAPHSPSLNYRMGLLDFNEGNLSRAEMFLRVALDNDPDYPDPLIILGDMSRQRGKSDEAIHLYRRAIDLGKADEESWTSLAMAQIDAGSHDAAGDALARAFVLAPKYPDAFFARARLELASGRKDTAVEALRDSIRHGGEGYRIRAEADPALKGLLPVAPGEGG